jgi:uncharacterized protein (DUF1330 family)
MPAYVIVEVSIHDPILYEEYKKLTPASIQEYGGEFIARGGKTLALEGNWNPERMVIIRFKDFETASNWWHSESYTKARAIRERAATTKMLIIEG